MAASVQDLLLRVRGDVSDAERDLDHLARELQQFDRTEAEAEVELDTAKAKRELRDISNDLRRLDARRVDVDVDIDRDGSASAALGMIGRKADSTKVQIGGFAQGARNTATTLKTLLIPGLIGVAGSLAPMIVTLVEGGLALAALGVAGAGAMAAIGALAGGAAASVKKVAEAEKDYIDAVEEHGKKSKEARTALVALHEAQKEAGKGATSIVDAWGRLKKAFEDATATGADRMLRGLADLMDRISGVLPRLSGDFGVLGRALGKAFRDAAPQVRKLVLGFGDVARASAPLAGPVISSLVSIGRIVMNIAKAAMPFLVRGAREVAQQLREWAGTTSSIGAVRRVIGSMVDSLVDVLALGKQIGRVVLAAFTALQGSGNGVVRSLTRMVRELANWMETAEGQKRIRQFFERTFFAVEDLAAALEAAAPFAAAWAESFGVFATKLLKLATVVLRAVSGLPEPLRAVAFAVGALGFAAVKAGPLLLFMQRTAAFSGISNMFVAAAGRMRLAILAMGGAARVAVASTGIGALIIAATLIILHWDKVKAFLAKTWAWLKNAAKAVGKWVWDHAYIFGLAAMPVLIAQRWRGIVNVLKSVWNWIKGAAKTLANAVKDAAEKGFLGPVGLIVTHWKELRDFLGDVWTGLKNTARTVWDAIKTAITAPIRAVADFARDIWNTITGIFTDAWDALKGKAGPKFEAIRDVILGPLRAVRDTARDIWNRVERTAVDSWNWVKGKARDAWGAVKDHALAPVRKLKDLLGDVWGKIKDRVRDTFDDVKGIVKGVFQDILGFIRGIGGDLWHKAKDAAKDLAKGFVHGIEWLVDRVKRLFSDVGRIASEIGRSIADWINDHTLFGDNIHIGLPGPAPDIDFTLPALARGVRNFVGGLALVGERGPELVHLPRGADVFANSQIGQALLSRLVGLPGALAAAASPGPVPALAPSVGDTTRTTTVHAPVTVAPLGAGAYPDADSFAVQLANKLRAHGGIDG